MTFKSILLRLLNIKGAKVDGIDFEDDAAMTVHVHLVKREPRDLQGVMNRRL